MRQRLSVLLLLFLWNVPIPGQEAKQTTEQGKKPANGSGGKSAPSQHVPAPVVNAPHAPDSKEKGNEQKPSNKDVTISTAKPVNVSANVDKDWMDKLYWVLTAALVVVGWFGVCAAMGTLREIRRQGITAREAADAAILNAQNVIDATYQSPTFAPDSRFFAKGESFSDQERIPGFDPRFMREDAIKKRRISETGFLVVYGKVTYKDTFTGRKTNEVMHETRWCYIYQSPQDRFVPFGPAEYNGNRDYEKGGEKAN
jgi:hypothetical protein